MFYVGLNCLQLVFDNLELSRLIFTQILEIICKLVYLCLKHLKCLLLDVDRFDRVTNRIFYVELSVAKTTDFASDSFSYWPLTCRKTYSTCQIVHEEKSWLSWTWLAVRVTTKLAEVHFFRVFEVIITSIALLELDAFAVRFSHEENRIVVLVLMFNWAHDESSALIY